MHGQEDNRQSSELRKKIPERIIHIIVASIAGGLVSHLLANLPIAILLDLIAACLLAYVAWHVFTCKKRIIAPRQKVIQVPCFSKRRRYLSLVYLVIFGSIVGGAVLYGLFLGAKCLYNLAVGGTPPPPSIELLADPARIHLGEGSRLTVLVNGEPAGLDYYCEWEVSPETETWYSGTRCDPAPYKPRLNLLGPNDPPMEIKIAVKVLNLARRPLGEASFTLPVHYAPVIEVLARPNRIFLGGASQLEVLVNGVPAGADYLCTWLADNEILTYNSCKTSYTPPLDLLGSEGEETSVKIEAQVFNALNKEEIGRKSRSIKITRPPPHFYMFVLDASARMGEQVYNEITRLKLAKEDISHDLETIKSGQGYVGIQLFGPAIELTAIEPCSNTVPLVLLAPLNVREVTRKLRREVSPGEEEAPLVQALGEGIDGLMKYYKEDDARFYLVTITGGPGTCENLAKYLAEKRTLTPNIDKFVWDVRFLHLLVGVAFRQSDVESLRDWTDRDFAIAEMPYVLILAPDPQSLQRILHDIALLSAAVYEDRRKACDDLVSILYEQGNEEEAERLWERCVEYLLPW